MEQRLNIHRSICDALEWSARKVYVASVFDRCSCCVNAAARMPCLLKQPSATESMVDSIMTDFLQPILLRVALEN